MPVYFVTAGIAVFYLCMAPIKIALILRVQPVEGPPDFPQEADTPHAQTRITLFLGVAAFEARFAKRHARSLAGKGKGDFPSLLILKSIQKAIKYLLHHLNFEQLHVQGTLSTGDAASTALLCGMAKAAQAALTALGKRAKIRLQPDFSAAESNFEATGMIGLRAGHIIRAALIFGWTYALGACRSFTNTKKKPKVNPKVSQKRLKNSQKPAKFSAKYRQSRLKQPKTALKNRRRAEAGLS